MATEKQYLFFKSIYDEENERWKQIRDHARNYLSLTTLYSAFILFVIDKLRPESCLSKIVFLGAILSTLAAFLMSLWAAKVSEFEGLSDPSEIVEQFEDSPMSDEAFFDQRIADYVVASERNAKVNDDKATKVEVAGYLLLLGILLQACYFILKVA